MLTIYTRHERTIALIANCGRDEFAHWLSGFTDGEGCFSLHWHMNKRPNGKIYNVPGGRFEIFLRGDDREILEQVRSFWGVGSINDRLASGTTKPGARYYVSGAIDLMTVVVPHFERYPLRAKKRHDFEIWRHAVALLHSVAIRPRVGGALRWSEEERLQFAAFRLRMAEARTYSSTV